MRKRGLNVGVIWVRVIEYNVFGLVCEEGVEEYGKDESKENGSWDEYDHKSSISLLLLTFLPLLFYGLWIIRVMLINKDLKMWSWYMFLLLHLMIIDFKKAIDMLRNDDDNITNDIKLMRIQSNFMILCILLLRMLVQ